MKKIKRFTTILMSVVLMLNLVSPNLTVLSASTEVKIECENATPITNSVNEDGDIYEVRSTDPTASNGKFYFMQTSVSGKWCQFTLPIAEDGQYEIYIGTKDNNSRGILQFSLNNGQESFGNPVDMYDNSLGVYKEHLIGTTNLTSGSITLRGTFAGKNAASSRYGFVGDYFRLVRVGDLPVVENPIFNEDFEGETTAFDTSTDAWSVVTDGSNKVLQGTAVNAGAITSAAGISLPETYTVIAKYTPKEADTNKSGGITFNQTDATHFYHLRLNQQSTDTSAQLYQWNVSPLKHLSDSSFDMKANTTYELRTVVEGTKVTCYIDGVKMSVDYTAETALTGGTVGMRIFNTTATFDDIAVWGSAKYPTPLTETAQIWNNEDSTYTESGTGWINADAAVKGQNDSGVRTTQNMTDTAIWADYPLETGNYDVYYWNPVDSAARAKLSFSISSQDGNWRTSVDTSQNQGGWNKIATIGATAGTMVNVSMALSTSGAAYADAIKLVKTSASADAVYVPGTGGSTEVAVIVNQLGYDTGRSKRATVVNVPDGTMFKVINKTTKAVDFTGTVTGKIADFTDLNPTTKTEYYIECAGAVSFDFVIAKDWIQKESVVPALAFMNEARQDVFKLGASTGYAWRDSHQFSFELNSLVLQYMANPALYDNMPYNIMEAGTCEYPELRVQDEPDIVWLMEFAALRYYNWGTQKDIQLHMLIKEQLAYFLYIYPQINQYVDEATYKKIRDFTIAQWGVSTCNKEWYPVTGTNHNLYDVQKVFGGLKGQQPPGHSIEPNLMMYEVAKRDGLGDSVVNNFFKAAYDNCEYTITGIDINDPYYAKGQRMSEHVTMEGLAYFQEMYPDKAPAGLKAAIVSWADKTIARSDNLWDTRIAVSMAAGDNVYKFRNGTQLDKDYWTGAAYALADGQNPAPKNEPGNTSGIQAITYAASRVLDDEEKNKRLREIGDAAIDDMFGRNPTSRAFFYNATRDFDGADLGWYTEPTGGYGELYNVTGVIDANAPESCYPYAPENYNTGYTEGWAAYNAAWNDSLAYSAADTTTLTVNSNRVKIGDEITITLDAPLNMDDSKIETGYVFITDIATGERSKVTVTENKATGDYFEGTFTVPNTYSLNVSYGFGIFENSEEIVITDYAGVPVTSIAIAGGDAPAYKGATVQLSTTVLPNDATIKTVDWTSSNETVATAKDGKVTFLKEGGVTITATSAYTSNISASCDFEVKTPVLESIEAAATSVTVTPNGRSVINVTGKLTDGTDVNLSNATVVYSTDVGANATVSKYGVVTAGNTEGTADINVAVTLDGVTVTRKVTITIEKSIVSTQMVQFETLSATSSVEGVLGISGSLVTFKPTTAGAYVDFTLPNIEAGEYRVSVCTKMYNTYGQYQLSINGQNVGSVIDTYGSSSGPTSTQTVGTVTINTTGNQTFRYTVVGKNDSSPGYNLALDYIKLEKFDSTEDLPVLTQLENDISSAEQLLVDSVIGTEIDQYPQETADELADAIAAAVTVVRSVTATQQVVDSAVSALNIAIQEFEVSKIAVGSSDAKNILTFVIDDAVGVIDGNTITVKLPYGTDVKALTPTITISEKAIVSPASSVVQDFTDAVTYTVTAENKTTKEYNVTVTANVEVEVSFNMTSAATSIKTGQQFVVTLTGKNITDLYAYEAAVTYDTNKLEFVGASTSIEGYEVAPINDGNKIIYVVTKIGNQSTENGDINLCTFTFKGKSTGNAYIKLNEVEILNSNLAGKTYMPNNDIFIFVTQDSERDSDTTTPKTPAPQPQKPIPVITNHDGKIKIEIMPVLDQSRAMAVVSISKETMEKAIQQAILDNEGIKNIKIEVIQIQGSKGYDIELSHETFSTGTLSMKIDISTPIGTLIVPSNMFSTDDLKGVEKVQFSMKEAERDNLDESIKEKVGQRPIIDIMAKTQGNTISWNNPNAPVTVSIPYTPTPKELENPEHIVVLYIDGQGKLTPVPNGKYDPAQGTVIFITNHFSKYAVAYVKKTFNDIGNYTWAKKQVEVLASKGIINGTSDTTYSPGLNITRADFITLLIKSLELKADFSENFDDVKSTDYYYKALGIAKALGITTGVGNNKFNPKMQISRQDMMVLVARALMIAKKINTTGMAQDIKAYTDKDQVSGYAVEGVATLIKEGIIEGSNSKINPKGLTTRAETAVIIYNIYNK